MKIQHVEADELQRGDILVEDGKILEMIIHIKDPDPDFYGAGCFKELYTSGDVNEILYGGRVYSIKKDDTFLVLRDREAATKFFKHIQAEIANVRNLVDTFSMRFFLSKDDFFTNLNHLERNSKIKDHD